MTEREWIFQIVNSFYGLAKNDILIGYHFRIIKDFDEHIPRIAAFWELQLLHSTPRKFGAPFDVIRIHELMNIKRGELGRWLVLFKKVLNETEDFPELKAEWFKKLDSFEDKFLRFFAF